jgi:hypothetical protein
MSNLNNKKIIRYAICGLPLAGIVISGIVLPSAGAHQVLVLITLLWMVTFIIFDVFSFG